MENEWFKIAKRIFREDTPFKPYLVKYLYWNTVVTAKDCTRLKTSAKWQSCRHLASGIDGVEWIINTKGAKNLVSSNVKEEILKMDLKKFCPGEIYPLETIYQTIKQKDPGTQKQSSLIDKMRKKNEYHLRIYEDPWEHWN